MSGKWQDLPPEEPLANEDYQSSAPMYGIYRLDMADRDGKAILVGRYNDHLDALGWIVRRRARRTAGNPIVHFLRIIT